MKSLKLALSLIAFLALTAGAFADDGWGRNSEYAKLYNPSTVKSVTGEITEINRDTRPLKGMVSGFSVMIKDKDGNVTDAQIGPAWFTTFYREKWDVRQGDEVTVTGSMVDIDGKPVMIVRQGSKGDLKMTCRSPKGVPVWDLDYRDF